MNTRHMKSEWLKTSQQTLNLTYIKARKLAKEMVGPLDNKGIQRKLKVRETTKKLNFFYLSSLQKT